MEPFIVFFLTFQYSILSHNTNFAQIFNKTLLFNPKGKAIPFIAPLLNNCRFHFPVICFIAQYVCRKGTGQEFFTISIIAKYIYREGNEKVLSPHTFTGKVLEWFNFLAICITAQYIY